MLNFTNFLHLIVSLDLLNLLARSSFAVLALPTTETRNMDKQVISIQPPNPENFEILDSHNLCHAKHEDGTYKYDSFGQKIIEKCPETTNNRGAEAAIATPILITGVVIIVLAVLFVVAHFFIRERKQGTIGIRPEEDIS